MFGDNTDQSPALAQQLEGGESPLKPIARCSIKNRPDNASNTNVEENKGKNIYIQYENDFILILFFLNFV